MIVFHVDSGGASPGLYLDWRPGPARRVPKTMAIFSCGVCGLEVSAVDAGVEEVFGLGCDCNVTV